MIVYDVVLPFFHVVFPGPVKVAPPLMSVEQFAALRVNCARNEPDPPVFADGVQPDSAP